MSATSNAADKKPGGSDDTVRDAGKGIDAPRLTLQGAGQLRAGGLGRDFAAGRRQDGAVEQCRGMR
jgi:hypothetical protein